MRKILLLLVLIFICAYSSHAQAPPTQLCNSGGGFTSAAPLCSWSIGNPTANHLLVVFVMIQSTTVTWVNGSDSCQTWTQVAGSPWKGTGVEIIAMQAIAVGGCGANTTMNLSGSATGNFLGEDYPGMVTNNSTVLDCASTGNSGNGTSMTSGSCTTQAGVQSASMTNSATGQWVMVVLAYKQTAASSDVLMGLGGLVSNSATFTAGGSYTIRQNGGTSSSGSAAFEDLNITAAASGGGGFGGKTGIGGNAGFGD